MRHTITTQNQNEAQAAAASVLSTLRLQPGDLEALRSGGTISMEHHRKGIRFKLRWRRHGRQHVRCLGSDDKRVALVRAALAAYQQLHRLKQRIAGDLKAASLVLRSVKPKLAKAIQKAGWRFHGRRIRRPRKSFLPGN